MRRPENARHNRIHNTRARDPHLARREPKSPEPAVRPDPGPRPLSQQQRAYQHLVQAHPTIAQTVPPVSEAVEQTPTRRIAQRRDATVSRKRVVLNRRRPNYLPLMLGIATTGLVIETIAALLFSPRLAVRQVTVAGNQAIPTEQILAKANPLKGQNLLRFPVGSLHKALLQEPTFEMVDIWRIWPDIVRIRVRERQPWASVQTADGTCYTIDSKLVPFRKSVAPEKGLPQLKLSANSFNMVVVLGKKMTAPGLSEVSACLEWAKARPDFPMDFVAIDREGKLCFNRKGGTQIQLGSATDLPLKLNSLSLLMQRYNISDAAYVNLYAYDAPAVMPKNAVTTASAKAHSSSTSSSSHRLGTEASDRTAEQQ